MIQLCLCFWWSLLSLLQRLYDLYRSINDDDNIDDNLAVLMKYLCCRFHPSCMGMTIEEAKKLDHFLCSDCSSDVDAKRSLNTFSVSPSVEAKVRAHMFHFVYVYILQDKNQQVSFHLWLSYCLAYEDHSHIVGFCHPSYIYFKDLLRFLSLDSDSLGMSFCTVILLLSIEPRFLPMLLVYCWAVSLRLSCAIALSLLLACRAYAHAFQVEG